MLGITGSIAAYKAAFLVRLLKKEGAEVKVILSPAAKDFVSPLTLATLSGNPVFSELVDEDGSDQWNNHVELGLWADRMIIAPATANTLAKMANGQCDNMILAAYLSAKCPVYVSPAMDLDMYKHPGTKENLSKLESFGNKVIPVGFGELASGLVGEGRMAEPQEIIDFLKKDIEDQSPLSGKKVLITAGPTYEPIDPVRFIGNRSSGKMGFALAQEAANLGAEVTLIHGPVHLSLNHGRINKIPIETAVEMLEAVQKVRDDMDVLIFSAAVADFRPATAAQEKIKKDKAETKIDLEMNPDILADTGANKKTGQILVGFALETENARENALSKLKRKNCDFLVLNTLKDEGAGFGHDTNKVSIINANNTWEDFELKSKQEVAKDIWNVLQNA